MVRIRYWLSAVLVVGSGASTGCGESNPACVRDLCAVGGSGVATGGMNTGGGSTGGMNTGGLGGSTGGTAVGGQVASGGATSGGAPSGGGAAGGALQTGGASATGGTGTGGATPTGGAGPSCDTSWDTYPDKGDGVALTPPLGWNSWNAFHENISEQQIRQIADAMVTTGLRDAGYIYLNLDDKWMDDDGRDGSGRLVGDSVRFPSGMKALADYVHGKGLKFGLYGDRGTETCAHYNANSTAQSGSYGHEAEDAQTFAAWGVDYLKYDNCAPAPGRDGDSAQEQDYRAMGDALKKSGRPIVFSICAWDGKPWMPNVGHLWRSTFDIGPCFSGCDEWYRNIDEIIDENNETPAWAGPGHWNDPDMMVIGNSALNHNETVAHFSMWAIMAAPIILGNDLRSIPNDILEILTNEEVLAVNQDPGGMQGTRVVDGGNLEVWMKPLCNREGPEKAVALFNRGGSTARITANFKDIGVAGTATVRDLWTHQDLGEFQGSYSADVPSHGVVVLKVVEK
jgi:alpha-galactosidase